MENRRALRISWFPLLALAVSLAVWVMNVSTVGARAEGCPVGCATVGERRDGPLRVMSVNVLHGYPGFEGLAARLDLIAEEIGRQEADIVCLQEAPWTKAIGSGVEYLAERTGMNSAYVRANGNRRVIEFEEGEAILSRYPLREIAFKELEPRAGYFEHRVVLSATAAAPWGDVRVYVTHLTDGEKEINRRQVAWLLAFVQTTAAGPAIVAGDFNARETSPQITALAAEWVDAYRAANPDDAGPTCCIDDLHAGPDEPLEERIDYIWLASAGSTDGQRAQVRSARRVLDQPFRLGAGWQWASDHVGLLVEIEIGPLLARR